MYSYLRYSVRWALMNRQTNTYMYVWMYCTVLYSTGTLAPQNRPPPFQSNPIPPTSNRLQHPKPGTRSQGSAAYSTELSQRGTGRSLSNYLRITIHVLYLPLHTCAPPTIIRTEYSVAVLSTILYPPIAFRDETRSLHASDNPTHPALEKKKHFVNRSASPGLLLILMPPTNPRRVRPQHAANLSGAERGVPAGMRTFIFPDGFDTAIIGEAADLHNVNAPPSSSTKSRVAARLEEYSAPKNDGITTAQGTSEAKLELSPRDSVARRELLRGAFFSDWRDDASSADLEDPDEMQKKDPLATQIWKLYSKTKTQLPNQERMENLTWRMMAMSLKRKKREQARCVSRLLQA